MEENRNEVFENNANEQQTYSQPVVSETGAAAVAPAPKKRSVAVLVLQIVTAVIYVLLTAYLTILLIDVMNAPPPQDGEFDARGIAYAAFLIIAIAVGGIGYLINIAASIVGIIVSSIQRSKGGCGVGPIIYFVVFIVLPILTFIFYLVVPRILLGN